MVRYECVVSSYNAHHHAHHPCVCVCASLQFIILTFLLLLFIIDDTISGQNEAENAPFKQRPAWNTKKNYDKIETCIH